MSFSREIIQWYGLNKRDLPWRETKDPYAIWLSEVILQQTRVAQGTPYYLKFIAEFPTVFDLAGASEESVLKLWQGLGYYSRARNLHAAAKQLVVEFKGVFPQEYGLLKSLKGVGDYTASAIASICFNAPEAVLDGNVFRVLSRYLGQNAPINSSQGAKLFKNLALEYCDKENPSEYNQGIMEFGALQCVPQNPLCSDCPLQQTCVAYQTNTVAVLPVKIPKAKPKKVHHHYMVFLDPQGQTLYNKRTGKGIWEGLYEFPLLSSLAAMSETALFNEVAGYAFENFNSQALSAAFAVPHKRFLYNSTPLLHKLTHRHIYAHFWIVETQEFLEVGKAFSDIDQLPTSVLISDFINAFKNSYF